MRIDIYSIEKKLQSAEQCIMTSDIPNEDKQLIIRFADHLLLERGLSVHRVVKYLYTLKKISEHMDRSFQEANKDDLVGFVKWLRVSNYSDWTKRDYKLALKKFYGWLQQTSLVDWIKPDHAKSELLPEQLITEQDILAMILSATSPMSRAFISVLYETGGRIGEIGALQIPHIIPDSVGAILNVDGKTGPRAPRIVWSASYLEEWLDIHPGTGTGPVWISQQGAALGYGGLRNMFLACARNAGIEKRAYHHLLRHSRATNISGYMPESRLNEYLGWVQGSDMPRFYIHLAGQGANDNILSMYGLQPPAVQTSLLWPRQCPECGKVHGPTYQVCLACGSTLGDVPRPAQQLAACTQQVPTHQ